MARIKKRDDGRYAVSIVTGHKNGKAVRKYFYSRSSLSDARKQRDAWCASHVYGGDGLATPRYDGSVTLETWTQTWLDTYKGDMTPNTRDYYFYNAKALCEYEMDGIAFGDMAMQNFKPMHLMRYINGLTGCSKSKIRAAKLTISQIFGSAKTNGLIDRDISADITETVKKAKIKGTYEGHIALSTELKDLICKNYQNHRGGLLVMLMMWAGLRNGEAAGLRWEDIDFDNDIIFVNRAVDLRHKDIKCPKTECGIRKIKIFAPLRKALDRNRQISGFVCTSADGSMLTDKAVKSLFQSFLGYLERIVNGVPNPENAQGFRKDKWIEQHGEWKEINFSLYDLRDTFATSLYDAGCDLKSAQKMMGHKDASTTLRIYTKLSEESENNSAELMQQYSEQFM